MPLYEYRCDRCGREWDEWHSIQERDEELCCGSRAVIVPSLFAGRPNGVRPDLPKLNKFNRETSQVYDKDGNKKYDNAKYNEVVDQVNAKRTEINQARGHKDD